ncbi:MAG TPA: GNAT family N-acetyltransferase [Lacisediminihabitans sp.]|uniref:GNAT family N-acetyltransferase n=1 Tax=Lacisediminihabitans sp. TaxID=2787631 RepID=UPI002ED82A18
MDKIELRTERLTLRPPRWDDVTAITAACQDPELQRRVPVPVPYTRADAEDYVRDFSDRGWSIGTICTWALIHEGAFSGVVGLEQIRNGQAAIGFWMAPGYRRRGLLSEAATRVIDFGFAVPPNGLGLVRIEWHAYAGNLASARTARRLGFRFEGMLRLGAAGRDGRQDDWVGGLLLTDDRSPRSWPILDVTPDGALSR